MPNSAKGKFFKYKVGKYESNGKKFKLHFMDQTIEPEITNWIELTSNEEDKIIKQFELKLVDESKELYLKDHGIIQKTKRDAEAVAK